MLQFSGPRAPQFHAAVTLVYAVIAARDGDHVSVPRNRNSNPFARLRRQPSRLSRSGYSQYDQVAKHSQKHMYRLTAHCCHLIVMQ
jgi:hypothetical protein